MRGIPRPSAQERIASGFRSHPIVTILGPRQSGKTTLARAYAQPRTHEFLDLEHPVDARRLEAPLAVLERLRGLVVIDEVQRRPQLLEVLRVLVDRPDNRARFLLLGSASPAIVRGVSESLAGRSGFVDLTGFDLSEVGPEHHDQLWLRGGFPRSYLAGDDDASLEWRNSFIRTFLERDVPQLGITVPAETLRRFWTMVAHFHGQVWNAAEFARSLGTSESTARRYLDLLAGAFMIRVLPPWFENLRKRQVRSPKVFLRDSGLLHALLEVSRRERLEAHPKLGASWEGFVIEQTVALLDTRDAYFWGTHAGAELDLFLPRSGRRYGIEVKFADAPRRTRSMTMATRDLKLDRLFVVYPGAQEYDLDERTRVVPVQLVARRGGQPR